MNDQLKLKKGFIITIPVNGDNFLEIQDKLFKHGFSYKRSYVRYADDKLSLKDYLHYFRRRKYFLADLSRKKLGLTQFKNRETINVNGG